MTQPILPPRSNTCRGEHDFEPLIWVTSVDEGNEPVHDITGRIIREYRRVEQVYCRRCTEVRTFVVEAPAGRSPIEVVRRVIDPNNLPNL